MKHSKINLFTDLSFLAFLFLFLCTVIFIAFDTDFFNVNIIILSIATMIMVVTYFKNLFTGLLVCALLIFTGIIILLYFGLQKGYEIPSLLYFWCVILPAYTVCIGFLSKNTNKLQKEVTELEKNIADLVTIDDLTGLKNHKQFMSDTEAYMHIAKRYNLKLAIMVAELRYQDDVERIVGKQNMSEIIIHISRTLSQSVRPEDLVYIVDTQRFCFAVLMMTNNYDGIKSAMGRMKNKIAGIHLKDITRFANVDLNMRIGFATMDQGYLTVLDFLNAAKHELEFDVS